MAEPDVDRVGQPLKDVDVAAELEDVAGDPSGQEGVAPASDADLHLRGLIHDLRNATGFVTHSASQLRRYVDDLLEMCGFFDDLVDGLGEKEQELLREFKMLVPVDVAQQEIPRVMETIREGERRIAGILEELRPARLSGPSPEARECDLVTAVEAALAVFSSNHGGLVQFSSECKASPHVACDDLSVARLLDNLLLNAVKAVSEKGAGGKVDVTVQPSQTKGMVDLVIRDDGVGMAPEVRSRVFQSYFTTRERQGGTGLGLAVVQQVVDGCGGRVSVESSPGLGTVFLVEFPAVVSGD